METTAETNTPTKNGLDEAAKSAVKTARDAVQDEMEKAGETLDRVSAQAREEIRKVSDQTNTFVRENPGVAIAGALGVGVLVGMALRQRY